MPQKSEGFLSLKPVVFHVLLALADEPLHGYGVVRAVRESSGQVIRLETGAFYRHLRKLLQDRLVEEAATPAGEDVDPRRGSHYQLTELGRGVLRAESRRLASIVDVTREMGLLDGSTS